MMALLLLLLIGDGTDAEYLAARATEITERYEQLASRQAPEAVHERATLARELAHLPFENASRAAAGRLLARMVEEDRSFRVRAEAAHAIARVGTPQALAAMVRGLFGAEGSKARFELLYTVLPEALGNVRRPDDLAWIATHILGPSSGSGDRATLAEAGPLERELVTLTLEGIGRAGAASLGPAIAPLARAEDPQVRAAAVAALASLGIDDPALEDALEDPDQRLRAAAAGSRTLEPEQAAKVLADPSALVRGAAIRGLAARSGREPVALLVKRLADETDVRLRLAIADALLGLTGKDFGPDADLWRSWWAAAQDGWAGPGAPEPGERTYFFDLGLRTAKVTFVIDVSASMGVVDDTGLSRLGYAARELDRAVRTLPAGARFRVFAFSGDVRPWPSPSMASGDRSQADAAAQALRAQKPGGPTNTYGALMMALEDPFEPDTIVLLTDGTPYRCSYRGKTYSEPEQILAEVAAGNPGRAVRIHAVALRTGQDDEPAESGTAVDFLRRLAVANRGDFREIR